MKADQINQMSDPDGLRNLMKNARRLAREDVYKLAFQRLCALEGQACEDPLERDFLQVLNAYEELLYEKHGRRTPATRTRQKLKNKGVRQCLMDWTRGEPTSGFELLMKRELPELTGEYLVVKHADEFSAELVAAAKRRLACAISDKQA